LFAKEELEEFKRGSQVKVWNEKEILGWEE